MSFPQVMCNCEKFDAMSEDLFPCVRYVKIHCERWINSFVVNILVHAHPNSALPLPLTLIFPMRECLSCSSLDVRGFMKRQNDGIW